MIESLYGIKLSRLIVNISIYFITVIPSYIWLYQTNKIGFWIILTLENIVTYYLFEKINLLELIEKDAKPKDFMILTMSMLIGLVALGWAWIKHSDVFWTIIIIEVIYVMISRIIGKSKKEPS